MSLAYRVQNSRCMSVYQAYIDAAVSRPLPSICRIGVAIPACARLVTERTVFATNNNAGQSILRLVPQNWVLYVNGRLYFGRALPRAQLAQDMRRTSETAMARD